LGNGRPNIVSSDPLTLLNVEKREKLTIILGDLGNLEEEGTMQAEMLSKQRRVLGDEHPDTIIAVSNPSQDSRILGRELRIRNSWIVLSRTVSTIYQAERDSSV
jgi:hypothetical protein